MAGTNKNRPGGMDSMKMDNSAPGGRNDTMSAVAKAANVKVDSYPQKSASGIKTPQMAKISGQ